MNKTTTLFSLIQICTYKNNCSEIHYFMRYIKFSQPLPNLFIIKGVYLFDRFSITKKRIYEKDNVDFNLTFFTFGLY